MTVAFVGKGTRVAFGGGSSAAPSKSGCTAGNLVLLYVGASRGDTANTAIAAPSGWTAAQNPAGPSIAGSPNYTPVVAIFYKLSSAGGTESATVAGPAGTYGWAQIAEFSGGPFTFSSAQSASAVFNTGATSRSTGTTGANSIADAVALAIGHPEDTIGNTSALTTPAGWTSLDLEATNSVENAWSAAYQILTNTGTRSATHNWTTNSYYAGAIAIFEGPAASGVTGTVAWTEANDTASLAGSATVSGTSSWTEANDTASITGSATVSGTASWTEANDAAALAGSSTVSGTASWTEANDSASIAGSLTVSGTAAWIEANDAASITGNVGSSVSGSISWTEANDTASVAGSVTVSGSVSWTEANDSTAISGTVGTAASGTIAWTEANDTASLAGSLSVSGAAAWTEASDGAALAGSLTASGSVGWSEADDSWLIGGFAGSNSGTIAWTEADDAWSLIGQAIGGAAGGYDQAKKIRKRINELNKKILQAEAEEAQEITQTAVTKAKSAPKSAYKGHDEDEEEALMLLL